VEKMKIYNTSEIALIGIEGIANKYSSFVMMIDTLGNLKKIKKYQRQSGIGIKDIINTNDNFSVLVGSYYDYSLFKSATILIKTKFNNVINSISGEIVFDLNQNCKKDNNEKGLKSWVISAKNKQGEIYYGNSEKNGSYQILLTGDTLQVSAVLPNPYFSELCKGNVIFDSTKTAQQKDIFIKKEIDCPYLSVDLSTLALRPCFDAVQVVKYCNQGSVTAQNAYIEVQLDPSLTYDKSTKPAIAKGNNLYRFNLGDMPIDSCAIFTITTKVKCDNSLAGKTLCSTAHIYPDSICLGNKSPVIQVSGNCTGTKIDFSIKNTSNKNMVAGKNYLIIEDDVMFKQGNFQLNGGQSLPISIPAKAGKTYRIIAEQTEPTLGAIATTAFENCNATSNGSTGFINQFSQGDDSPFEDVDCRVVTNSYDPNDKQGIPTGVKAQHFIPKNTDIEYMIRFQNSGTDTAFTVVLRDTLSKFLDPATIIPGGSSHPYRFDLLETGIAKFSFFNIKLPHEKADKIGSNGFVKFRIKQRTDNPNGTVINNRAGIYFDFNDPILTNTTTHTIGENWLIIVPVKEENVENVNVKIYPNPFSESTVIEVNGEYKDLKFNLLDMSGRLLRTENFDNQQLIFDRNNLQQGLYIYEITSQGKRLQHGKVVVQ
jgi:uncharacterized repeat protein (TIGR01451 family)